MRKMVVTDLNDTEILKIERRTQIPKNFICYAPEGVESAEVLDIVDDIDPDTQEVRGKKAVVNQAKVAAKQKERATSEQARANSQETKRLRRQTLAESLNGFDSMSAAQKWALVKMIIEEISGA